MGVDDVMVVTPSIPQSGREREREERMRMMVVVVVVVMCRPESPVKRRVLLLLLFPLRSAWIYAVTYTAHVTVPNLVKWGH